MHQELLLALTGIGLMALASQTLAWWLRLPAIVFLLAAGIIAGPVTGWLDPDALFGDLLFPFVSLAVAVILFEGGLTLRLDEIRGLESVVRRLLTTGVLITWGVTAGAAAWLLGLSTGLAVLFGAMVTVTGPTVIVPMLRTVRPTHRVANVLRWEGIVIDPIGALLSVLVFEFLVAGRTAGALGHTFLLFGEMLAVGILLGVAVGHGLGVVLRRHWLPEFLHDVTTVLLVFGVFTGANLLVPEAGLLAVTVMGIWLANMPDVHTDDILDFKESLSVLLISGLFILLAARLHPAELMSLGWPALALLAVIQFVARPLKVAAATWGSNLSLAERGVLAWIAPRGIVAAAVASLFSLRLEELGFPGAASLVPLTFLVIVGTVVFQSATARPLARLLGVAEPEPNGFLVLGAHRLGREIARALADRDFPVLVADTDLRNIRAARFEGLRTYYGNIVSRHADRNLSLISIGRLLALAPSREENTLAALRYRTEFGAPSIHSLPAPAESSDREEDTEKETIRPVVGRIAFDRNASYEKLDALLEKGFGIRATDLTESFTFEDYRKEHDGRALPLFAVTPGGRIKVFESEPAFEPAEGWTIIGLAPGNHEHGKRPEKTKPGETE